MYTMDRKRTGRPADTQHLPSHGPEQQRVPNSALLSAAGLDQAQIPQAEHEAEMLSSLITSGSPESVKAAMGARLGADFSAVRFHTGSDAAAMADRLDARAFTSGRDIYFGPDGFDAGVAAHELVHTVQQGVVDSGTETLSTPAGGIQRLPMLPPIGKNTLLGDYRNMRTTLDRYTHMQDGEEREALKRDLLQQATAYRDKHSRMLPLLNNPARVADAENIIDSLTIPDLAAPEGDLEGMNARQMADLRVEIARYNTHMQNAHNHDPSKDNGVREQELANAKSSFISIYQQVGGLDQNQQSVAKFTRQMMDLLFNFQEPRPRISPQSVEAAKDYWAKEFGRLVSGSETGRQLFGEIFARRYAVDQADRRTVTLRDAETSQDTLQSLMHPLATSLRRSEDSKTKAIKNLETGAFSRNTGTDMAVELPGIPVVELYKQLSAMSPALDLQNMGAMMAGHELIHAMHGINGMQLSGSLGDQGIRTPGARPVGHDVEKRTSMEEIFTARPGALSVVTQADTPHMTMDDYLLRQFEEGESQEMARRMLPIHESALRRDLGLPALYTYQRKQDSSQVGQPEQNMTQAKFNTLCDADNIIRYSRSRKLKPPQDLVPQDFPQWVNPADFKGVLDEIFRRYHMQQYAFQDSL